MCEHLLWCPETECLARPCVEQVLHRLDLGIGHRPEICAFRKVLADQSIGVFVQPALPGVVGPGKIELGIKRLGQADVASEFLAIVRSDCVNQVSIRFQSALDPRSNIFGRLPVDPCQAGQLRDAVYHRGHCTALTCSDNRVRLPVADPQLLFDDRGPLTDRPKGPEAAYLGFRRNIQGTDCSSVFRRWSATFSAENLKPRPSATRSALIGYFGRLGLIAVMRKVSP